MKCVGEVSAAAGDGAPRVAMLAPGEQLDFDAAGRWARRSFDPETAKASTDGQLVFRSRPLAEVAAEMNRYNTVKIQLAQPDLDELQISGQFYSNDPASLIQALELAWSTRAERPSKTKERRGGKKG